MEFIWSASRLLRVPQCAQAVGVVASDSIGSTRLAHGKHLQDLPDDIACAPDDQEPDSEIFVSCICLELAGAYLQLLQIACVVGVVRLVRHHRSCSLSALVVGLVRACGDVVSNTVLARGSSLADITAACE